MSSPSPLARIFWNPVTAYMVAAVIALAWLFQPVKPPDVRTITDVVPYPAAIIDVALPRPTGDSAIFFSPTQDIYLMRRGRVAPAGGGHTYDIELTCGPNDSSIIQLYDLRDYDSVGNAGFTTQTSVGDFTFKVYDILEADTTVRTYPFSIRFER
jgi:hypothetical protein